MEGNKFVWHFIVKKPFALKILDFSLTQFKSSHPHGASIIFAETLQIFATEKTLSKNLGVD